ncbi:MAG: hypothetical protein HZB16_19395 [Armatimonadetes bacterium]|nr:hypothetical protein [Armatimonadota bacterium]
MRCVAAALVILLTAACGAQQPVVPADTVVATDHLGRALPTAAECGPPKAGKQVGIFYFLWLGEHAEQGPWDIAKILAQDPQAMSKPDSPLWGPMYVAHHWGEPLFGYYRADDPYVLRKHAQMLSDAGVDFVVFDVTNNFTYKPWYLALLKTWSQVRAEGGKTPQVAFLTPFWQPARAVAELWRDLYQPGISPDLWYRLDGKPLILADPDLIAGTSGNTQQDRATELTAGHTLGQSFHTDKPLLEAGGSFPTWTELNSAATLSLRRGGPTGEVLVTERREKLADNAWWVLRLPRAEPAGDYYLELSQPTGKVGWWSHGTDVFPAGEAYADGRPAAGDRTLRLVQGGDGQDSLRSFFTWRKPQADYFQGPTGADQWCWLEVYPQHVYRNSRGEKEMMGVGIAQNAVDRRLGAMSEKNSKGRAWHDGANDPAPDASDRGLNGIEQWRRAREQDPRIVFVTGWNEWIAGRFPEFAGVKEPVMFVDEFDREHSRDIEPMVGGHRDAFYYQLVGEIRRFKGVATPEAPSAPKSLSLQADPAAWASVAPTYRDDAHDEAHRNHLGYGRLPAYVNESGRNDIVEAKLARDADNVTFRVETREPITPHNGERWMWLLIDIDGQRATGWEGYDFIVNRQVTDAATTTLERCDGTAWSWTPVGQVGYRAAGRQLVVSIPRRLLGLAGKPVRLDFKWVDHPLRDGDIDSFTTDGDAAPNGRFNYRFAE